VKRKKKPKNKKKQSLPRITPEQEDLLGSLLENLKDIELNSIREHINSPQLARAVSEKLPATDQEEIQLLLAIKDSFREKEVQKAVKKALFKMKRRGFSIPEHENHKAPLLGIKRNRRLESEAYLSPIDGTGSRSIFIAAYRIPKGVDIGIGTVNTHAGIDYFIYGRYSRKQSRDIKSRFFDHAGKAVETSLSHAATILETARKKNERDLGEGVQEYLRFRPWLLKNTSLLDRPPIYDLIPPEDISGDFLTDSRIEELLGHDLLASWIIRPEKTETVINEISSAEASPIILSEAQITDRIEEIKERAIQEIYPESERLSLKDDLEEMAYVFFKLGEKGHARICLAAASTMSEKDSPLRTNKFLKAYIERSINHYINIMGKDTSRKAEEADSFPSIITP
jgi:hypothetical protein